MDDKKILHEENIAKVTGGRYYANEPIVHDPAKRDERIKEAASHGLSASKALPKELMEKVVGGATDTYVERCPSCGEWELIDRLPGGWKSTVLTAILSMTPLI